MKRTDRFCSVDGIELHYSAWGAASAPPVVCLHGLSRVGRDFDPIARRLADTYRVLCPDLPGRGQSGWADPTAYTNEASVKRMVGFCDALGLESIRWIGTSMGGGIGMALAGGPLSDRISHLVVNDISPDPIHDAEEQALARINEYVPQPPTVDTVTALEAYYREIYEARFSEMTDAEWRRFTVTSARRTDDGQFTPAYDPQIIEALDTTTESETDPWAVWDEITAEICVVRGTASGILPREPFERMIDRQPTAKTITVDCGHAPALNTDDQIDPIESFFAQ